VPGRLRCDVEPAAARATSCARGPCASRPGRGAPGLAATPASVHIPQRAAAHPFWRAAAGMEARGGGKRRQRTRAHTHARAHTFWEGSGWVCAAMRSIARVCTLCALAFECGILDPRGCVEGLTTHPMSNLALLRRSRGPKHQLDSTKQGW